ncbi:alanine racemase [Kingella negevensis]|uniref:Alanine racemase n=1 Tax=Kingella negevensis TaxID=1522312 RepID=A0A238TEE6_9NEIS|nr:alanine racemase [Kingella negevensis]MDK4679549.1 alanine racemase [Kingella negevensis]MDK4682733.1 alanine racemase [Kingella negevensis]MDK4685478.1 alanine racemase [Kingella negevensis]MDK4690930.1 alanine racemase [Kingella negevensis]MDK4693923.1 alanine racemase [Kingella negevensis]
MRPLVCEIRLNYLRENYLYLKKVHGNKLLAVVKANAYGHGAVQCAQALHDIADGFAVAFVQEAIELRENGITKPIVLLEGALETTEYAEIDKYDLWTVVHNQTQLENLLAYNWQKPATVWLKMDSGMHRVGFFPHNFAAAYTALSQSNKVANIVKMTHFACADEDETGMTEMQIEAFDLACEGLDGEESIANSAAMLRFPETHRDWGRAGLALYGIDPMSKFETEYAIKPVMRLSSKIFSERVLQPHEPIGYGASFYTKRSTRVGVVACGYADGYPRCTPSDTPVAINGARSRVIGRVSMDMMTVDLHDNHFKIGDEVELFGDVVNINELASAAGTITYEILCNMKRAKRIYVK